MWIVSANQSSTDNFLSLSQINGYSTMNNPTIVKTVHTPIVFRESLACSTAPVLTSLAISNIFNVASNPGNGRGSSTNQTLLKIMKYIIPRKPANMLATIPIKARVNVWPASRVINGPEAKKYSGLVANKKIAGKVKIKPVEACVAPVVADVAMLTSEGLHCIAIPSR